MIDVQERMKELCKPVEQQILMCDSREDILMMACRKQILEEANND